MGIVLGLFDFRRIILLFKYMRISGVVRFIMGYLMWMNFPWIVIIVFNELQRVLSHWLNKYIVPFCSFRSLWTPMNPLQNALAEVAAVVDREEKR